MKRLLISLPLLLTLMFSSNAFATETSGTLPLDEQIIYGINLPKHDFEVYGDKWEISWTTKFKKTGKCRNAQLQFTSNGVFGPPDKRGFPRGFLFYSADFKTIIESEGIYSKKLENKSSKFVFGHPYSGGQPDENELSSKRTRCLTLGKSYKSPLQIYYWSPFEDEPNKGELVATIPFKEKR